MQVTGSGGAAVTAIAAEYGNPVARVWRCLAWRSVHESTVDGIRKAKYLAGMTLDVLSSRERVNCALRFEKPDRTPRDLAAVPAVWQRL